MGMCVKISQKQCNVITKNVHKLMRVDGNEKVLVKGLAFKNPELVAFADSHPYDCERIGFLPDSAYGWECYNRFRGQVFELNEYTLYDPDPLPLKINEEKYLEAFNNIHKALEGTVSVTDFCINVVFVKVPKKRNLRIAYLEIENSNNAWDF